MQHRAVTVESKRRALLCTRCSIGEGTAMIAPPPGPHRPSRQLELAA
jgi:hypothetical protein